MGAMRRLTAATRWKECCLYVVITIKKGSEILSLPYTLTVLTPAVDLKIASPSE